MTIFKKALRVENDTIKNMLEKYQQHVFVTQIGIGIWQIRFSCLEAYSSSTEWDVVKLVMNSDDTPSDDTVYEFLNDKLTGRALKASFYTKDKNNVETFIFQPK